MKGRFERSIASVVKSGRSPQVAQFLPLLWILQLSWLVLFNHLGSTGLLDETEPLFAEAARQMQVTGDWITPYFNGATRFDKPPLIYWLMAIAYETIGVNEWAARLPSAISGTLLISFCFYTLRFFEHRFKPHTGHLKILPFLGSGIFALNLQTLFFGRLGYSDMLLSLCFGGALLSFFLGYAQPENPKIQTRFYLALYGFLALAVLTKGPVGVVLPGAIVLIFLVCVGKLREVLREIKLVPGILVFGVLSVPWYVLAYSRNGESFTNSFFGYHNLERFTNVVNQHQGAWYFHILIVLVGFFPWSIYLPAAIAHSLKPRLWRQSPRSSHLGLFVLIWFAVVLGFFTIAVTKYITYTLPLVPAAAILVALWWSEQQDAPKSKWGLKLSVYVSLGLGMTLAAVTLYSPHWLNGDPSMPQLGLQMQEAGLPQIGFLIWLSGAIAGTFLIFGRTMRWFWAVNLVTYAAFM
ncbi:MAG: glycosyltransferase family 39 protein, partial [Phormidesmis sp. CAN_BIN36]|nr:glycosyltransferase family 39 protein [Phormidesmis sp. CAN_BIN36]